MSGFQFILELDECDSFRLDSSELPESDEVAEEHLQFREVDLVQSLDEKHFVRLVRVLITYFWDQLHTFR
jgi:hypothetical protein